MAVITEGYRAMRLFREECDFGMGYVNLPCIGRGGPFAVRRCQAERQWSAVGGRAGRDRDAQGRLDGQPRHRSEDGAGADDEYRGRPGLTKGIAMLKPQEIEEITAALWYIPLEYLQEVRTLVSSLKERFGYDEPIDDSDEWTDRTVRTTRLANASGAGRPLAGGRGMTLTPGDVVTGRLTDRDWAEVLARLRIRSGSYLTARKAYASRGGFPCGYSTTRKCRRSRRTYPAPRRRCCSNAISVHVAVVHARLSAGGRARQRCRHSRRGWQPVPRFHRRHRRHVHRSLSSARCRGHQGPGRQAAAHVRHRLLLSTANRPGAAAGRTRARHVAAGGCSSPTAARRRWRRR